MAKKADKDIPQASMEKYESEKPKEWAGVNPDLSLASYLASRYKGEPVAFLCARYVYYGTVADVGPDVVILIDASAVEVIGSVTDDQPRQKDDIPSDVAISLGAVELVMVPTWVHNRGDLPEPDEG